jgi:hypothetical protein
MQKDIMWRKQGEIQEYLLAVKYVPLEKMIDTLYEGFKHADTKRAMAFFRERHLVLERLQSEKRCEKD